MAQTVGRDMAISPTDWGTDRNPAPRGYPAVEPVRESCRCLAEFAVGRQRKTRWARSAKARRGPDRVRPVITAGRGDVVAVRDLPAEAGNEVCIGFGRHRRLLCRRSDDRAADRHVWTGAGHDSDRFLARRAEHQRPEGLVAAVGGNRDGNADAGGFRHQQVAIVTGGLAPGLKHFGQVVLPGGDILRRRAAIETAGIEPGAERSFPRQHVILLAAAALGMCGAIRVSVGSR